MANLSTPEQFDQAAGSVTMEDIKESMKLITTIADLHQWIAPYREMGASKIILHNVHPDQELFITEYGRYHKANSIPSSP